MTNTQNMNNSEMSTQNIPNLYVCSLDEIESKRINAEESESHVYSTGESKSKGVIFNACSLEQSE